MNALKHEFNASEFFRIGKNFYYDSLSVIVTFNIPLKIDLDQSVL